MFSGNKKKAKRNVFDLTGIDEKSGSDVCSENISEMAIEEAQ